MDLKLFTQAIFKFLGGLLIVGLLLFLPAGTFVWRQAWLLLGILFVPMFIAGLIMMKRAPDLLRKRLDAKEGENVWLSRTVEVQENQKVVDTGLYGIVRHPMYMTTLLLFLSMPLVLGSVISFVIMLLYIPIIAKRIRNEEQVLEGGLEGYAEYKKRIRYKVIPFVW